MRIGELSERSGFSIHTLRYYDQIGLLRPAARNPISRFREYGDDALDLLTLVKAAKVASLSLPKTQKILKAARKRFGRNGSRRSTMRSRRSRSSARD